MSRTYQNYDGYAPIGGYLGQKRWCLGMELRPGSQHSQNGFVGFLRNALVYARKITRNRLLVRTDSSHDALETLVELRRHPNVSFIVRWNPRRANVLFWHDRAFREGRVSEPRPGKKVAIFSTWVTQHYRYRTYRFRLVIRVTERISDAKGQMLIRPDIKLEGWWTSLSVHEDQGIRLYEKGGLSEPFHSEIKSDLDLERLPCGIPVKCSALLQPHSFRANDAHQPRRFLASVEWACHTTIAVPLDVVRKFDHISPPTPRLRGEEHPSEARVVEAIDPRIPSSRFGKNASILQRLISSGHTVKNEIPAPFRHSLTPSC